MLTTIALLAIFVFKKGVKINEALFSVVKPCCPFQRVRRSKGCVTERHGGVIYTFFFIRKSLFCPSLNFLNFPEIEPEIFLKFSYFY